MNPFLVMSLVLCILGGVFLIADAPIQWYNKNYRTYRYSFRFRFIHGKRSFIKIVRGKDEEDAYREFIEDLDEGITEEDIVILDVVRK